jgi:hypothetical protein
MSARAALHRPLPQALTQVECYPDGSLRSCVPLQPVRIHYGTQLLVAQYTEEPPRRLVVAPIEFHENGAVKGITLQESTVIETPVGPFPAERLTFYANGALRRVFPTAGKPTATWTEEDEKARNPRWRLSLPTGDIEARYIGLCFYPSGQLRSVALWPGEMVNLSTPLGTFAARIGIAFHENGSLRSFEPASCIELETPIGTVPGFYPLAVGIHGDSGSVEFTPDGRLFALRTEEAQVLVRDPSGTTQAVFAAREIPSRCEESATERIPIVLSFTPDGVTIDGAFYANDAHEFTVESTRTRQRRLPLVCC